jgi:hypothetical protein
MKETAKEVINKTSSVWDWKSKPSIMAKDNSLKLSQAATKCRATHGNFPAQMQVYKEKK